MAKGVWPKGKGILNCMLYIKIIKMNNVGQYAVWLGCRGRGVAERGCGPRGCGLRGCGREEVWPKGGRGKKILNFMLYIKTSKI